MTIPEIAAAHGRNPTTLRKWALRMFAKRGRDYDLRPAEVRRLLRMAGTEPGRPRKLTSAQR